MLDIRTPIRFFMGVNTPGGFVGYPEDFYDVKDGWRVFLLKGGPGTGKTYLMKRVFEHMSERGLEAQAILCSSDPDTLDGLVFPEIRVCVLDANSPHAIEPKCWGAVEQIVNLSACMDTASLYPRLPEITEALSLYSTLETRCRKFIGAAASLLGDSYRIAYECTDTAKIQRSAARIAAREFGAHSETPGRESRCFLSAVTPEGVIVFHETLQALCPRIYSIEDEQGASSRLLLNELRKRALDAGLNVFSCFCPLFSKEKIEHLLIPSLGIGFTTSNQWHKTDFPVYRRIHAARFTDSERLRLRRQLMSFNRRAARELINEAVGIAEDMKGVKEQLKLMYADTIDYEGVHMLTEWVITELEDAAKNIREDSTASG